MWKDLIAFLLLAGSSLVFATETVNAEYEKGYEDAMNHVSELCHNQGYFHVGILLFSCDRLYINESP